MNKNAVVRNWTMVFWWLVMDTRVKTKMGRSTGSSRTGTIPLVCAATMASDLGLYRIRN